MPETISIIPPPVVQYFDRILLTTPCCKFTQDSVELMQLIKYLLSLTCKTEYGNRRDRFDKELTELMELYDRIEAKEKELKEKDPHPIQMSFHYFGIDKGMRRKIFRKVEQRSRKFLQIQLRKNNDIQEV